MDRSPLFEEITIMDGPDREESAKRAAESIRHYCPDAKIVWLPGIYAGELKLRVYFNDADFGKWKLILARIYLFDNTSFSLD